MDVEMAVAPARDEGLAMQPHEASIADKLDARLVQCRVEACVEGLAQGEVLVVDGAGWDVGGFRVKEPLRLRHIRDDQHDVGGKVARLAGLDQGLKIGAPA